MSAGEVCCLFWFAFDGSGTTASTITNATSMRTTIAIFVNLLGSLGVDMSVSFLSPLGAEDVLDRSNCDYNECHNRDCD